MNPKDARIDWFVGLIQKAQARGAFSSKMEFARALGLSSPESVSRWLRGDQDPFDIPSNRWIAIAQLEGEGRSPADIYAELLAVSGLEGAPVPGEPVSPKVEAEEVLRKISFFAMRALEIVRNDLENALRIDEISGVANMDLVEFGRSLEVAVNDAIAQEHFSSRLQIAKTIGVAENFLEGMIAAQQAPNREVVESIYGCLTMRSPTGEAYDLSEVIRLIECRNPTKKALPNGKAGKT